MIIRQFKLVSGNKAVVSFLEDDHRLVRGIRLTLVGEPEEWTITERYPIAVPVDKINRGWNNNI